MLTMKQAIQHLVCYMAVGGIGLLLILLIAPQSKGQNTSQGTPGNSSTELEQAQQFINQAIKAMKDGKPDEAIQFETRVITIIEKVLGPEHEAIAQESWRLARFYQEKGDLNQAEIHCLRAEAIWEKKQGPDSPGIAT